MLARALTLSLVASLATPFVASPRRAAAAPSATDLENARQAYKQGKALRDKGDLAGAREKFKLAHALGQTPITGLELGKTHEKLGELVAAREAFLSVGRTPVASDETQKSADARVECEKLAEELKARIPTLRITLVNVPKGKKAKVSIDGEDVPAASVASPRALDPGKHSVVVKVVGAPDAKASIELVEGEKKAISIHVKAPAKAEGTAADEQQAGEGAAGGEEPRDQGAEGDRADDAPDGSAAATPKAAASASAASPSTGRSILVPIGLATAGVGLLAGAIAGGVALKKAGELKDACPGGVCAPANQAPLDETRTLAHVSTAAFALAGVGAALGVVGLLSRPSTEPPPAQAHVRPYVGLGCAGVVGAF